MVPTREETKINPMQYLYHHVPAGMEGTILYPLNQLKDIYPGRYEKQVKKYERKVNVRCYLIFRRIFYSREPLRQKIWKKSLSDRRLFVKSFLIT